MWHIRMYVYAYIYTIYIYTLYIYIIYIHYIYTIYTYGFTFSIQIHSKTHLQLIEHISAGQVSVSCLFFTSLRIPETLSLDPKKEHHVQAGDIRSTYLIRICVYIYIYTNNNIKLIYRLMHTHINTT